MEVDEEFTDGVDIGEPMMVMLVMVCKEGGVYVLLGM